MNELAGHSLGGYLLEEELGRGSMGVVYRGKQIALGREVAIKVLPRTLAKDPSYVARFIREAQIIAGLNHPNIVQIYDAGQQGGLLYFVMEYVQGPTIGNLLHIDGTIPLHLAAEYAAQIADALDVAYSERHVIHRDIKPENLMLDRWGKIKVMDFGLARAPGHQQITVAKTLVGSIYYASPEQVWGHVLDNRSDIYALGVVLYEMVTGQRPFTGRTLPELTQAIIGGPLRPPSALNSDIAPALETIILTAMARDREERYERAAQMAEELRALQPEISGAAEVAPPQPSQQPPSPQPPQTRQPSQTPQRVQRETHAHLPRRPQVKMPNYLQSEKLESAKPPATSPLPDPGEHALPSGGETMQPPLPGPQDARAPQPMPPGPPKPPPQPSPARQSFQTPHTPYVPSQRLNHDDIPTARLVPGSHEETREDDKDESHRSFWQQLQRIFKNS